jgi:hypothetical protein
MPSVGVSIGVGKNKRSDANYGQKSLDSCSRMMINLSLSCCGGSANWLEFSSDSGVCVGSGISLDTMLMFYRDRLYMISSNYHSAWTEKEITTAFGKPQKLVDEDSCWYRKEVLYEVTKNGDDDISAPSDLDTVQVVDFNYAPSSLRAQRKGNPMCGGILEQ